MRKIQRYTKEQMYGLIPEWENSGLTREKFFSRHGIPQSTFGFWRKEHLREASQRKVEENFNPVKVGNDRWKTP